MPSRASFASTRSAGCRRSPCARTSRAGATLPEEECRLRTPFQRDRDRIVHSKAFRRLRHKTQVFVDPEGDHFRTRLTHTLEAAAIARGVARALRLNEDLDRGDRARPRPRPSAVRPRRRAGARRAAARARRPRLPPQRALAARRRAARAGRAAASTSRGRCATASSSTPAPTSRRRSRGRSSASSTASRTSTTTSTTPSAPGSSRRATCREHEIALLGDTGSRRIDTLVHDLVENSARAGDIVQSEEIGEAMLALRSFMFERVYLRRSTAHDPRDRAAHLRRASSTSAVTTSRTRPTTSPA